MVVSDVGKLSLLITFTVGLFALVLTHTVEWGEAAPFFTLIGGYLFGNGTAAVRGKAPSTIIVPPVSDGQVAGPNGIVTTSTEATHGTEA